MLAGDIYNQPPIYGNNTQSIRGIALPSSSIGESCRVAICNTLPCPAPLCMLGSGRTLGIVGTRRMREAYKRKGRTSGREVHEHETLKKDCPHRARFEGWLPGHFA